MSNNECTEDRMLIFAYDALENLQEILRQANTTLLEVIEYADEEIMDTLPWDAVRSLGHFEGIAVGMGNEPLELFRRMEEEYEPSYFTEEAREMRAQIRSHDE